MIQFAMIANRMKSVVAVAAVLSAFASAAQAGDQWRHGHHPDHGGSRHFASGEFRGSTLSGRHHRQWVENRRFDRQGDGQRNRPSETDRIARYGRSNDFNGGSSSIVRGFDTYAGSIEAYSIPGNGAYFVHDDGYWPSSERRSAELAPRAKIIDVEQEMGGNAFASERACSFEAGVCVIRGRN